MPKDEVAAWKAKEEANKVKFDADMAEWREKIESMGLKEEQCVRRERARRRAGSWASAEKGWFQGEREKGLVPERAPERAHGARSAVS
jgi:hypothetical protein